MDINDKLFWDIGTNISLMSAVLFFTALLLSSTAFMHQGSFQWLLLFVFAGMGFLTLRSLFLAYITFVFLYPLIPSVPEQIGLPPFDLCEFLFLSLAFWWAMAKIIAKGFKFHEQPLAKMLGLFVLYCSFSAFLFLIRSNLIFSKIFLLKLLEHWNVFLPWSQQEEVATLRFLLDLIEGCLFFFITIDVLTNHEKMRKVVQASFFVAVAVSVLGILQYVLRFKLLGTFQDNPLIVRINSTFSDPNALGTYLTSFLLIGIFSYLVPALKETKTYYVCTFFILVALIFTASRAAWGAACLIFFFVPPLLERLGIRVLSSLKGFWQWTLKWGFIPISIALLLVTLVNAFVGSQYYRPHSFMGILFHTVNPHAQIDSILKGRVGLWKAGILIFEDHPIFGSGIGTFPRAVEKYSTIVSPFMQKQNAHNYYLQLLAETGLPGFFLFAAIVFSPLRSGINWLKTAQEPKVILHGYGLICSIAAFLLTSVTGHPLLLLKMQLCFWSLLAMLTVLARSYSPIAYRPRQSAMNWGVGTTLIILMIFGSLEVRSILKSRQILPYEFGFYDWERDAGGPFRWTKDSTVSLIKVKGKVLKLTLSRLNPEIPGTPTFLEIYLDERLLDRITIWNREWKEHQYYLLGFNPSQTVRLSLRPSKVLVPKDTGQGQDSRKLGVALRPFAWDFDAPQKAIGVYEEERQGGRAFVWTRMQASFPLEKQGSRLTVPLFFNNPTNDEATELLFYWNDQLIKTFQTRDRGWRNIELNLPASTPRRGVLSVRVSKTFNPALMGLSNDHRDLGVGVGQFQ